MRTADNPWRPVSAGIILHRRSASGALTVFACHPGGPFWRNRDAGAWSIPKGLAEQTDVELEAVARREFQEEVGVAVHVPLEPLGAFRQPSGKLVHAWHGSQDVDERALVSNTFEMEWPPRSGQMQAFPEIDRGGWFTLAEARDKLLKGQVPILDALEEALGLEAGRQPAGPHIGSR